MKDLSILDSLITGRVEPHIYAFTTNTIPNYLKVGDTYRPVSKRLSEWREYFPNLEQKFEGSARITDDVYFRDFAVHYFLESEKHRTRLAETDLPEGVYYSREFFREATVGDVEEAIADIHDDYESRSKRQNASAYVRRNAFRQILHLYVLCKGNGSKARCGGFCQSRCA